MSSHPPTEAARVFFDHFRLLPGTGVRGVEEIVGAFSALPWENLTKYLRKIQDPGGPRRPRDPLTVMTDHVERGGGGTCFSLTETLREIVLSAGMEARPAMADMRHGRNIHCALLIRRPGGWLLADPGYLVPVPVALEPGRESVLELPGQTLTWASRDGGATWDLHTTEQGVRTWRYALRTDAVAPEAFRRFWVDSFDAPGMNGLHLNRRVDGGRISAHDRNLRVVEAGGSRNEKLGGDFAGRVSGLFGLDAAVAAEAESAWTAWRTSLLGDRGTP